MERLIAKTEIDKKIKVLILPTIEQMGFELIRVKYNDGEKASLQIMLDKINTGIQIDECASMSATISTILDVDDTIDTKYNLEISSPGINRPLTRKKDFELWEGHITVIKTTETIDQRKKFKGILRGIKNNEILLEIVEGTIGLSFDWIEEAYLLTSFDNLFKNPSTRNIKSSKKPKLEIN